MRRLLFLCLAIVVTLGVGCNEQESASHDQYYVLWITARVVDSDGNPIQGIYVYPEGYAFAGREGYTNYLGEMGGTVHIEPNSVQRVVFEDIDGEYNGGVYATKYVDIAHLLTPTTPADKWGYSGSSLIELGDVVLTLK